MLCASQPFSLVKLNSFLFFAGPSPTPLQPLLVFCGLILLGSRAISPELLLQALSSSDNFTLLRFPFSLIFSRFDRPSRLDAKAEGDESLQRELERFTGSLNASFSDVADVEGRAAAPGLEWII